MFVRTPLVTSSSLGYENQKAPIELTAVPPTNNDTPANNNTAANNDSIPEKQEAAYDETKVNGFDRFFEITKRKSKISTEIIAGIVTFLSMSYILSTNPNVLVGGAPTLWNSVYIATAFASGISTLVMALLARMPFALAPGFN
jgi:hypothetical protein